MENFHCWRTPLPLLAVLLLTSCIDHHPYPGGWEKPLLTPENKCADIRGTFDDNGQGENEQNKWTGTSVSGLGRYFWPTKEWIMLYGKNGDTSKHVVLKQSDNVIKVSVWTMNELIAERELKKDDNDGYRCTAQGVVLNRPGNPFRGFQGRVNRTLTLFKDSEGALLLKKEESGVGLAYIVPLYIAHTLWRRYLPFHKP